MRFSHKEVNFEVSYDDHHHPTKCSWNMFWVIFMTFICDLRIDLTVYELIFVKLSNSQAVWLFDIWHINWLFRSFYFGHNLTSDILLKSPQPVTRLFLTFLDILPLVIWTTSALCKAIFWQVFFFGIHP